MAQVCNNASVVNFTSNVGFEMSWYTQKPYTITDMN